METNVNNKCKAFTSLEQSEKLAEILPLKSADMFWLVVGNTSRAHVLTEPLSNYSKWKNYPCWSLSALLNVLPDYTLQTNSDGTVFLVCDSKKPMISDAYNNPVDAYYEMILKLYELKML